MLEFLSANVTQKIQTDFPQAEWENVAKILMDYAHENERERVHLDILELAQGKLQQVQHFVNAANQDYRDILYWGEYYENDPWILWQRLLEMLRNADHLSEIQYQHFWNTQGAGFWRQPSLAALEELCRTLIDAQTHLSKPEFEQLRAYGIRWKSKAYWKPLRRM